MRPAQEPTTPSSDRDAPNRRLNPYPINTVMTMTSRALAVLLCLLVVSAASAQPAQEASPPKTRSDASAQWSEDGLRRVDVKGLDVVYMRPGAGLSGYRKVWLGPVTVSFRRGWERSASTGIRSRISAADAQRIRERLAVALREELLAELARGGYQMADAPGDDVLQVNAAITDLYINAPESAGASNVRVFAVSAGEMTLVAELRDSLTGEVVARVYDHAEARETGMPHRMFAGENEREARAAARAWSEILRRQLDLANTTPPPAVAP